MNNYKGVTKIQFSDMFDEVDGLNLSQGQGQMQDFSLANMTFHNESPKIPKARKSNELLYQRTKLQKSSRSALQQRTQVQKNLSKILSTAHVVKIGGPSQSMANFQHLTKGGLLSQTFKNSTAEFTQTGGRSVSKDKNIDKLIRKNLKK